MTLKQKLFVLEYPKDLNATEAAIRAGFSPKTARYQASRLLAHPEIQQSVSDIEKEHLRKVGVSTVKVLTELARLASSDVRKLYRDDGTLLSPGEWDNETAAAVAGVEVFEEFSGRGDDRALIGFTKKVKLWDKPKSLEILAKHLKLLIDKVEVTGKDGEPFTYQIVHFGGKSADCPNPE